MAKQVSVEVVISKDGSVSLSVDGTKGKGCLDVTKALEAAIGKVSSREKKSAFYLGGGEGVRAQV